MRPSSLVPVAAGLFLVAGCAATPEPSHPSYASASLPTTSAASSSVFSASSHAAPSTPATAPPAPGARAHETTVNVIARPDVLVLTLSMRAANVDATRATEDLRQLSAELEKRFRESASPKAKLVMFGAAVELDERVAKKSADKEPRKLAVTAQGAVEIPLEPGAAYWERARTFAAAMQVAEHTNASMCEGPLRAHVASAEARVKNPGAHRKELLDKWAENNRSFAKTAQLADKPLEVTSCTPPAEVTQRAVSLEEVELGLPVSCQPLQVVR